MTRLLVIAVLFSAGVMIPLGADKDHVSGWLVRDRPHLVSTARTVKLALLCQRWPVQIDRVAFAIAMRERAGVTQPYDKDYASQAIAEGETWALLDFKAEPMKVCDGLGGAELAAASDFFAGRKSLRETERAH